MWQHWDRRIQNMWVLNGALLCFLLSVFLMKIPESNAKFTDNLWLSDGNSSGITDGACYEDDSSRLLCFPNHSAANTPEECKEACGSLGFNYAGVQMGNECWCGNVEPPLARIRDSSECGVKCPGDATLNCGGPWRMNIYKTMRTVNYTMSSMAEAIKERLENIPPKRDTTSELSKTLLKLDDLIRNFELCSTQDIMNISQYNVLEDLFVKIVENPSLDDHFPDFASSFAMAILPKVIQSKNEDSPLIKSKLETPFPDPVEDSADPHEEIVTINGNYENCVFKDKPGKRCFDDKWVSTGLYAKQGQLIKVTVPSNAVGKFDIQLSAHTDRPFEYNQEKWLEGNNHIRPCCITQEYAKDLIKEETKLLSAYGGIIYIKNIPDITSQLGNFTLKFDKVITSPTFIEGKTTNEQWYKMLTSSKSPMTELEVPGVIVTIPKFQYENAHYNMEGLSSRLSQLMQAFFDMAGYVVPRPHRYVYDLLPICPLCPLAHSGYPSMDGRVLNYTDELLSLANATDENFSNVWGMLHEIGHNIQNPLWKPEGLGETTNNIFAQYALEEVLNVNHDQMADFNTFYVVCEEYKKNDRNFSSLGPFGTLNIFMFVKDECSWNTYKKFFKYYNEEEIPQSMQNDEIYSLIARVLSEKCNKNLIPFFKWWNWPIISDDEEATKNLPEWMGIIDRLENSKKNGPDYLKEKDTDFTGSDIGSKKSDGE